MPYQIDDPELAALVNEARKLAARQEEIQQQIVIRQQQLATERRGAELRRMLARQDDEINQRDPWSLSQQAAREQGEAIRAEKEQAEQRRRQRDRAGW